MLHKTGRIEANHEADLEKALSWRYRTFIFRAEALADVAQEFNRYNRRQIVIADVEFLIAGAMFNGCSSVDQQSRISIEDLLQDTCSEVIPLIRRANDRDAATESGGSRNRWKLFGLTASVALLIAVGLVLSGISGVWLGTEVQTTVYSTEMGEQQTITLEDGSVVLLNTLTNLETKFSRRHRDIYLNRGEAIFKVAKDMERPLRVFIGGMIVQAVGTIMPLKNRSSPVGCWKAQHILKSS